MCAVIDTSGQGTTKGKKMFKVFDSTGRKVAEFATLAEAEAFTATFDTYDIEDWSH